MGKNRNILIVIYKDSMNKYYNPEKRRKDYLKNKKREIKRNVEYMRKRRHEAKIQKYRVFLEENGYIVTKSQ